MKQHCENAEKVVNFLKKHKEVTKVIYSTEHEKNQLLIEQKNI